MNLQLGKRRRLLIYAFAYFLTVMAKYLFLEGIMSTMPTPKFEILPTLPNFLSPKF